MFRAISESFQCTDVEIFTASESFPPRDSQGPLEIDVIMPSNDENSSGTSLGLLVGLRADEKGAWQRLVELYGPVIDLWCRRDRLQEADAADIRQEVFLVVRRKIGDFRRESATDSFRGWLRTITRNKIADRGRLGKSRPAETGLGDRLDQTVARADRGDEGEEDDPAIEGRILYRRALALIQRDFEDRTWRAFWGVVIDGRTATAVAFDLGVPVTAVYLAKSRVLKRLREEFEGFLDP